MTASLTPNREAAQAGMWWLFQGATLLSVLADTTGASPAPSLDAASAAWDAYLLDQAFDLVVTGGAIAFDATLTQRAELPQVEFTLSYGTSVTYTDVLVFSLPANSPGAGAPSFAGVTFVGVIHEPSAVTLSSSDSKTYKVDLYSEWF